MSSVSIYQLPIEVWLEVLSQFSHVREMLQTHRALSSTCRFLQRVSSHGAVWNCRLRLVEAQLRHNNRFVPFSHSDYAQLRKAVGTASSPLLGGATSSDETGAAVQSLPATWLCASESPLAQTAKLLLPDWRSCFVHCYIIASQRCVICMKCPGAANSPFSAFDVEKFSVHGAAVKKQTTEQHDESEPLLPLLLRFPLAHCNVCMVCLRYHFVSTEQLRGTVEEIVKEKELVLQKGFQQTVAEAAPRFKMHRWNVIPRVWIETFLAALTIEDDKGEGNTASRKRSNAEGEDANSAAAKSASQTAGFGRIIARAYHTQQFMRRIHEQESTRHLDSPCDPLGVINKRHDSHVFPALYFTSLASTVVELRNEQIQGN